MQHTWIFQLGAPLHPAQATQITQGLNALVAEWKAHGTPVPGHGEVRYDRFVVVQATPGSTSGCSIDSMTRGVETLLQAAGTEVLAPNFVFFREADGSLAFLDFREIAAGIAAGRLHADTTIYDGTMGQTNDLSKWEVALKDSWLARYLPQEA